jgi:flagella basal body P-ring formation protein FlgA
MKAAFSIVVVCALMGAGGPARAESPVSLVDILAPVDSVPAEERNRTRNGGASGNEEEGKETSSPRRLKPGQVLDRLAAQLREGRPDRQELQLRAPNPGEWPKMHLTGGAAWEVVCHTAFSPEPDGKWMPRLSVLEEGRRIYSFRPEVEVSLYREVWTTSQRLERGQSPTADLLKPVVRNLYERHIRPIPVGEDLSGFEVLRTLPAGRILEWGDLRERPLVRRGEIIKVIVEKGGMNIVMRARCLDDGARGKEVNVRNLDTRHEFQGIVVGRNQVRYRP